jgi:threonylcarbamoyladenosine tRNA methylthiotransferase MtaB
MEVTCIFIETMGCKLNQAESEEMSRDLAAAGYRIVSSVGEADVFLLKTCTVTRIADRKARQAVRSAVKANPEARVIITGCYAERDNDALKKLPGVVGVLGNGAKGNVVAELERLGLKPSSESFENYPGRTRLMIKVQDGCDHRCAYCIVPFVRPVKSCVSPETIIEMTKERQAEEFREIVLTGTEIGEYSWDDIDLRGLLSRILKETQIYRIRVSSLQPQEVTPELINLWKDKRLCRHFHLSLQSGSDPVLHRMRRRYSTEDYRNAVKLIREHIRDVAITTDIIAGFPGETDAEFQESFTFIESIGFSRLHVFPFSPRPGTVACSMPGQIDAATIKSRVARLLNLGRRCEAEFRRRFRGQQLEVLIEAKEGESWVGYTDNYIRVAIERDENLQNHIIEIEL